MSKPGVEKYLQQMLLEQNISECCETELKIKIKIFHQSTLTTKKNLGDEIFVSIVD
jgi:hypothetical protein